MPAQGWMKGAQYMTLEFARERSELDVLFVYTHPTLSYNSEGFCYKHISGVGIVQSTPQVM